ncbi:uncharacterized protein I206_100131 [Kwoniella pini CBS 10737]|uniref:Zn(2)-C6 fungal-type domain-containing protein n=1 Tax=Kwoniella pini CBS 10737 TaxID=1296096 RepID=A0A1B9IE25_9TREE|nr:uncharacterized protein I206_01196 [Kwoniella pini CBS 10737]OCF53889.1 hypothetical protein I206_01196 [Kwoniella pini CBS 10737]
MSITPIKSQSASTNGSIDIPRNSLFTHSPSMNTLHSSPVTYAILPNPAHHTPHQSHLALPQQPVPARSDSFPQWHANPPPRYHYKQTSDQRPMTRATNTLPDSAYAYTKGSTDIRHDMITSERQTHQPSGTSGSQTSQKKRPREISTHHILPVDHDARDNFWDHKPLSPDQTGSFDHRTHSNSHSHSPKPTTITISVPAVLTRDKKQKACANCRKAKLKCILEHGSTECIRCKSRKEKCTFFPRSHDEEVQQRLIKDMYEATTHLAQLSKAVQHILQHLTQKNLIPPFVSDDHPDGLDTYIPPNQHMVSKDDNEHSGKLYNEADKADNKPDRKPKARKIDTSDNDEKDEFKEHRLLMNNGSPGEISRESRSFDSQSSYQPRPSLDDPVQTYSDVMIRPPPTTIYSSPLPFAAMLPSPHPQPTSIPPNRPSRSPPPLLASPDKQVHPSIGQVLNSANIGWNIGRPPIAEVSSRPLSRSRMSSPPMMSSTPDIIHQGQHRFNQTVDSTKHYMSHESTQTLPDEREQETIGSQDPRKDIVKKGLVSPQDAMTLVNYFHESLSPLMYGYTLSFHQFPYISGPAYISPLLLSVLCLISSERMSSEFENRYHSILAQEVTNLLQTSPAESWQRFEGIYTPDFGDPDGDDPLDAEFGLGPEEIVASCILATYMVQREQASVIARSAFRWARGWIRLLQSSSVPRFTIAESVGLVPPERKATNADMARIWLLCYIVDSTERLQLLLDAPPARDAISWCSVLIPPTNMDQQLPYSKDIPYHKPDILLTFHARLITILNDWRTQFKVLISASQPSDQLVEEIKDLSSNINERLGWWKSEFENLIYSPLIDHTAAISIYGPSSIIGYGQSNQHIMITFHFIRSSVNATLTKYLPLNRTQNGYRPESNSPFIEKQQADYRLRIESKKSIIESSIEFFKICHSWFSTPNMSPTYLYFVTFMGSEMVDAIEEVRKNGKLSETVMIHTIIPLLHSVGETLLRGDLNENHVSKITGKALFSYCEKLQKLR